MSLLLNFTEYSNATADNSLCNVQPEGIIFWTCAILVSFVFGFPGAVVVLLDVFQKGRKGTSLTPNDVFVSNISVLDGLNLVFLLPDLLNLGTKYGAFVDFLFSLNLCGRPLFITCICLDCYLAVVHPVTYRARKGLTPTVLMVVAVWTVMVAVGIFVAVVQENPSNDLTSFVFFALTLPVIGFCDVSILWTLKRSNLGRKEVHPQKKKAMQIIMTNLVLTLTCYFPPIITMMVTHFLSLDETTSLCLVLIPVLGSTCIGNTASLYLHLINRGKLDWLKCWKHK